MMSWHKRKLRISPLEILLVYATFNGKDIYIYIFYFDINNNLDA